MGTGELLQFSSLFSIVFYYFLVGFVKKMRGKKKHRSRLKNKQKKKNDLGLFLSYVYNYGIQNVSNKFYFFCFHLCH